MSGVSRAPGRVGPLIHEPLPVVPLVKSDDDEASMGRRALEGCFPAQPGVDNVCGKGFHVLFGFGAGVVQPEAGEGGWAVECFLV